MALKQLRMARQLQDLRADLEQEGQRSAELAQRRDELKMREKELETAINEAQTEEEKKLVDEAVAVYETDETALEADEANNNQRRQEIQSQITALEEELNALNERMKLEPKNEERKDEKKMDTRMNHVQMNWRSRVAEVCRTDEGKAFLQRVREMAQQNRAITGAELTIPDVFLGMMRETTAEASKLLKHVSLRRVGGTSRVNVMGPIPEAVWTEMCATLNELSLSFTNAEMDGYMVGGIIYVCNAILEDSDVALATEIVRAFGAAIGQALDKAIIYGTGTKMPLGIVTRLAQTAAPENYSATQRAWVDLHSTNLIGITSANQTGIKLFQAIANASAKAKGKYSTGAKFWAMNEATRLKLAVEAMNFNSNAAIVSGVGNTMPVVGGVIETLEFMPDNMIVGGYGELYIVAERAGTKIDSSTHVRFPQMQTAFRGYARYDGMPVIAEGFVGIGIAGTAPAASDVSFAQDTANAS